MPKTGPPAEEAVGNGPAPGRRGTVSGSLAWVLLPSAPQRLLALATFINTMGSGLFMVSSTLFFTRSVGLPAVQVGVGLTMAATVGLLVGIPAGHLADRYGPRETYIANMVVGACAMAIYVFVHDFAGFLVVASLTSAVAGASAAIRGPLVRGFGGANAVRFRAYLNSVTNLGVALGALAAGVGLQIDSRPAYLALILGNALSFLGCAAVVSRLPRLPALPIPDDADRWQALRDRRYMAVTCLNGIMAVHYSVLTFALPLWIVQRTHAPLWLVSVVFLVNTLLVVLFQVPASRGISTAPAAGAAMRRAGIALLGGVGLMAAASSVPPLPAALLVVLGCAVYTLGELWHSAASFELSFGLAAPHAQGQYSGVFALGQGAATAVAPTLLGFLCLGLGVPGWLLLGGLLSVVGATAPAVVKWASIPSKAT